jgi:hypothetical protein
VVGGHGRRHCGNQEKSSRRVHIQTVEYCSGHSGRQAVEESAIFFTLGRVWGFAK